MLRVLLVLLLASPAWATASAPLETVGRARALLGGETWTRIVQVDNVNPHSVYPPNVYALVFELGGLLWFYTDTDGTQSFSLHRENLAAEKADFAPLLLDIDRGFIRHTILVDDAGDRGSDSGAPASRLPNGCLIESYAALRELVARGELILSARLLSYHAPGRRVGHTVLAYETPRGLHVIDPARGAKPTRMRRSLGGDALALARALRPAWPIRQARWVPTISGLAGPLLAAVETPANALRAPEPTAPRRSSPKTRPPSQAVRS